MIKLSEMQKSIILGMARNNMTVSAVARDLHYHRNNIIYHIDIIRYRTGLDPMCYYDLCRLVDMVAEQSDYDRFTELKARVHDYCDAFVTENLACKTYCPFAAAKNPTDQKATVKLCSEEFIMAHPDVIEQLFGDTARQVPKREIRPGTTYRKDGR